MFLLIPRPLTHSQCTGTAQYPPTKLKAYLTHNPHPSPASQKLFPFPSFHTPLSFCQSLPQLKLFTLPGALAFNKNRDHNTPEEGLINGSPSGPLASQSARLPLVGGWGPQGQNGHQELEK